MLIFGLILCFPTMSLIIQFSNTIYNGSYSWAYHICKCHAHGPQVGLLIILSFSWVNFSEIDFPTFSSSSSSSFYFFKFFFFKLYAFTLFPGKPIRTCNNTMISFKQPNKIGDANHVMKNKEFFFIVFLFLFELGFI